MPLERYLSYLHELRTRPRPAEGKGKRVGKREKGNTFDNSNFDRLYTRLPPPRSDCDNMEISNARARVTLRRFVCVCVCRCGCARRKGSYLEELSEGSGARSRERESARIDRYFTRVSGKLRRDKRERDNPLIDEETWIDQQRDENCVHGNVKFRNVFAEIVVLKMSL